MIGISGCRCILRAEMKRGAWDGRVNTRRCALQIKSIKQGNGWGAAQRHQAHEARDGAGAERGMERGAGGARARAREASRPATGKQHRRGTSQHHTWMERVPQPALQGILVWTAGAVCLACMAGWHGGHGGRGILWGHRVIGGGIQGRAPGERLPILSGRSGARRGRSGARRSGARRGPGRDRGDAMGDAAAIGRTPDQGAVRKAAEAPSQGFKTAGHARCVGRPQGGELCWGGVLAVGASGEGRGVGSERACAGGCHAPALAHGPRLGSAGPTPPTLMPPPPPPRPPPPRARRRHPPPLALRCRGPRSRLPSRRAHPRSKRLHCHIPPTPRSPARQQAPQPCLSCGAL
jgi:hypothetical protein